VSGLKEKEKEREKTFFAGKKNPDFFDLSPSCFFPNHKKNRPWLLADPLAGQLLARGQPWFVSLFCVLKFLEPLELRRGKERKREKTHSRLRSRKKNHSKKTAPGVNCVGPFACYRQHPAVVTAPFIAPGRFVGESCVAAAEFGTVRRNVLHVFDKGATPDMEQLAAQVSGAVVGISGAPLAPAAPELPSYGVPMPVPVGAGSSASSAAAVGADSVDGAGLLGGGLGGGIDGGGIGGGLGAPDAAAGASGSSGRK